MTKREYLVRRDGYRPSGRELPKGLELRMPVASDREQLASLLVDAYAGTIDYEGESLDDARGEMDGYLTGEADLETSRVAVSDSEIVAAVLMSRIAGIPMVGYVMTRTRMKNQGLASALVDHAVAASWAAGDDALRAFITDGNHPSERVFTRAGFEPIGRYET